MAIDLVLRGGTVVDGSGAPGFTADVAVNGDRIVEVGTVAGRGKREIDATGLTVTPGFVDVHTHFDAQINWDPLGTPSCFHGVTSVVMGNCGFTIAPVRKGREALTVRNLERAEDISAAAMAAGITWGWENFTDYLDVVDGLPKGINYAAQIGHSALRTWAMDERAFTEEASEDELNLMDAELARALDAGAVGFSTSRSFAHETSDDRPVASRLASWDEVRRLVKLVGAKNAIFEIAQERVGKGLAGNDFFERLCDLAVESKAITTFGVLPLGPPEVWRQQLAALKRGAAAGARMIGQSHSRGVSMVMSFKTAMPFDRIDEWKPIRSRSLEEQKQLLRDPEIRAKLVHAAHHGTYAQAVGGEPPKPDWSCLKIYQNPLPPNPLVADVARERGVDPVELMIDLALEKDFDQFFVCPPLPMTDDELLEIMRHPNMVMTFSDTGAHVTQIVDACLQTHLLAHWARDQHEFSLEEAVRMVTRMPAESWGFNERGLLKEGMIADINLIDLPALDPGMPVAVRDLPGGAQRVIMKSSGIKATLVAGEVLIEDGEHTGALPGQLLRRRVAN
jgi:N-acyl-D-aspartate/D-glutamate deacylase